MEVDDEKIKKLKELNIACQCALEYDNCPDESQAEWLIENLLNYDKDELILILKKYKGWHYGDLADEIVGKVEFL